MSAQPKVAVLLSGCGVYDGAEIHEAVLTLLALSQRGAVAQCFAPDIAQHHVINHLTGAEQAESRNVLVEAARIARGQIKPLADYQAADYDALILPGGFGAAKNLSSFAFQGPDCSVEAETARALTETHAAGKPIGALCIAPAVVAKVLGKGLVTIGSDPATAGAVEQCGATHIETAQTEIVVDAPLKLATSPCYMLESSIAEIAEGADGVVAAVLSMIE